MKKKYTEEQLTWLAENLKDEHVAFLLEGEEQPAQAPAQPQQAPAQPQQAANTGEQPDQEHVRKIASVIKDGQMDKWDPKVMKQYIETAQVADSKGGKSPLTTADFIQVLKFAAQAPAMIKEHIPAINKCLLWLQAKKADIGEALKNQLTQAGIDFNNLVANIKAQNEALVYAAGEKAINERLDRDIEAVEKAVGLLESRHPGITAGRLNEAVRELRNSTDPVALINEYYSLSREINSVMKVLEQHEIPLKETTDWIKAHDNDIRRLNESVSAAKYAIRVYATKKKNA